MSSAEQAIQSVVIDAYVSVIASGSVQQPAQTINISSTYRNQSTVQSVQIANAQAFVKINGGIAIQQSSQSLSVNTFYYDVGITASISQSAQGVYSVANIAMSVNAAIGQPKQYMSATVVSGVFSPQSAEKLMTKNTYRILRKVRNTGRR